MKEGKRYRNIVLGGLLLVMAVLTGFTVYARSFGTIELLVPEEAAGVQMILYPVAQYQDGVYIFGDEFADCGAALDNLNDTAEAQAAAEQLATYAKRKSIDGQVEEAGTDGKISFRNLAPALYLAAQTSGQEAIVIQPALITIPHLTEGAEVYDAVIAVKYSLPGGAVIVTKADEDGKALAQAHFVLENKIYTSEIPDGEERGTDKNGSFYWKEYKADLVSNENGQIVVTDLPFGSYRFVETQAPEGFILLEQPRTFEIQESGTVKLVSGIYEPDSGSVVELVIENQREDEKESESGRNTEPNTEAGPGGSSAGNSGKGSSGGSSEGSSPVKTGDETPVLGHIILLILAVILLSGTMYVQNRKR